MTWLSDASPRVSYSMVPNEFRFHFEKKSYMQMQSANNWEIRGTKRIWHLLNLITQVTNCPVWHKHLSLYYSFLEGHKTRVSVCVCVCPHSELT